MLNFVFHATQLIASVFFYSPVDRDQEDKEQFFVGLPFEKLGF